MTALSTARMHLVDVNLAATRALDEARAEVTGGAENRVARDLVNAAIRLQGAHLHVISLILMLADARRP